MDFLILFYEKSNNNIADYYMGNNIFLFTSIREPFGRVIIEVLE